MDIYIKYPKDNRKSNISQAHGSNVSNTTLQSESMEDTFIKIKNTFFANNTAKYFLNTWQQ